MASNGVKRSPTQGGLSSATRAEDVRDLFSAIQDRLIPFIQAADDEIKAHEQDTETSQTSPLAQSHAAPELQKLLSLEIPRHGTGSQGVVSLLEPILKYSVNTFAPGFLDKLYSATNAPGLAADLILSTLNTNVHVYQVSPVLTLIEKHTARELASMFGLVGPRAGGISCQGGSASNMTSVVVARNTLYPSTKVYGNHHDGLELVLFTSAHAHYSIEKAAQACGFGSASVITVPVDPQTGAMIPSTLDKLISLSKTMGKTPFYVNATAGTTVLGSFDPFTEIASICQKHNVWFHIDASWGGPFIFSPSQKHKLRGCDLADSIAINPHKMMAVPVTCSFLLAADLQKFHLANTLPAGYLFHSDSEITDPSSWTEPLDQADLTLQCGRRGDSLKLFLSWQYYGTVGYSEMIQNAHDLACYMAKLVRQNKDLILVSEERPPCLQVCFYYAPNKTILHHPAHHITDGTSKTAEEEISDADFERHQDEDEEEETRVANLNSSVTSQIAARLIPLGFMIDYAPPLEGREWMGKFFRVVVNVNTRTQTVDRLLERLVRVGADVVEAMQNQNQNGKR